MNYQNIVKSVGLAEEKILNVYITGSRLHGTETPSSDYDIIIIVEDNTPPPTKAKIYGKQWCLTCENCDLHIYPLAYVKDNLKIHKDFYVIELLWIPQHLILKQSIDLIPLVTFDKACFLKCVKGFGKFTRKKSIKLFTNNREIIGSSEQDNREIIGSSEQDNREIIGAAAQDNAYVARKNIGHEIRNFAYAYQVLLHDKIIDYTATSNIMFRILSEVSVSPEDYASYYKIADEMLVGLEILAEKMLGIVR
jgi:hypothetical protein